MGGTEFWVEGRGATAAEAFNAARREAQYEHGHGGYTGTIAEKQGHKVFHLPEGVTVKQVASWLDKAWKNDPDGYPDGYGIVRDLSDVPAEHRRLMEDVIAVYDDKWGPAVCLPAGEGRWVFCGWASC
jgi:hypothetical protein